MLPTPALTQKLFVIALLAGLCFACSSQASAPTATPEPPSATPAPPTKTPAPPTETAVPSTETAVPSTPTSIPTETSEPVGTDITQELPPGDAAHGSLLVETFDLDCASCHVRGHVGAPAPYWAKDPENDQQGVATRAQTRYLAADYTGQATSAREYLFESIVSPNIYIVPGRIDYYFDVAAGRSQMPGNFGKKLDKQMLADVIAYLETIK